MLEDYPHDTEEIDNDPGPPACPINFNTRTKELTDKEHFRSCLQTEIDSMQTWHDIARAKHDRSTADLAGLSPLQIIELFSDFIDGKELETATENQKPSDLLRMAAEDLKAFYLEAVSAQPGQSTNVTILADWFWGETHAANLINEVRKTCLKQGTNDMELAGKLLLIPRNQMHRFKENSDEH